MARFDTFAKDIQMATADIAPDQISAHLARFAREELEKAIKAGKATANYDLFVNYRPATSEFVVEAPGPIVYEFSWWRIVIKFALEFLVKNSPRQSGRFASSFIVIVDGKVVTEFDKIPPSAEVIITNAQPYVRKVQVGAMKMTVPPKIFDKARSAVARQFGVQTFRYEVRFLDLSGGLHPLIPYRLKGSQGRRKDRQAGMPITYPSLILNMVD
ncbi:hypothetical protein OE766_03635 [Pararhizobium sp. YC-54]|uniref:hypothetical protein n=1 Tax=Pararhizobium sp. YC-54 TaxID=2986920 RepID=UPI0021F6FB7F|nr:hypothetical protein [Pararhizobium sp. YC-54]MCV9997329.1 hypothetical protein [Pararhizobium sp. YC-54]